MKILLHACCGPCSLEPVRLLREAGHELAVYYANANIHPEAGVRPAFGHAARVGATMRAFPSSRERTTLPRGKRPPAASAPAWTRAKSAAAPATACASKRRLATPPHTGTSAVSTTLTVSPYQYTLVIEEEVRRAAEAAGIAAVFEDFRPQYDEATRRSRALGMYRQNYCGCRYSAAEAARERAERKAARAARKAAEQAAHADERAAEEAARAKRKAERAAYDEAQARKHAVLKALRAQRKAEARAAKDAS